MDNYRFKVFKHPKYNHRTYPLLRQGLSDKQIFEIYEEEKKEEERLERIRKEFRKGEDA